MDDLPLHLQTRIYGEAGVSGICTTSRDELLRTLLLADQRSLYTPLEAGDDAPPPHSTWHLSRLARRRTPPQTEAAFRTALARTGHRFRQLQHTSVDASDSGSASQDGLHAFVQHVAPELAGGTRLTVRESALPLQNLAPPWQLIAQTHLGAACTRLDVTSDALSITHLLGGLARFFPAVEDVRVRCHPAPLAGAFSRGEAPAMYLSAPDSLTTLTVLLCWDPTGRGQPCLRLGRALGLKELICIVHAPEERSQLALLDFFDAQTPSLRTVRGFPRVRLRNYPRLSELVHLEVSHVPSAVGFGALQVLMEVCEWLRGFDNDLCPRLLTVCLRVEHPDTPAEMVASWAATNLRFAVQLVT